jgi:ankyrin repeat protein
MIRPLLVYPLLALLFAAGGPFAAHAQKMPGDLQDAIRAGAIPKMQKLLQESPTMLNSRDNDMNTPLMLAVRYKKADVAAALLERNASVTLANNEGETALHLACAQGGAGQTMVDMLAEKRAPFLARTHGGDTPLHYAITQAHADADFITYLVNKGAKVNAPNNAGDIPLYAALQDAKTPPGVVDYLISAGSNLLATTRNGRRAMHPAAEFQSAQLLGLILDKTVTKPVLLNLYDNKGRTALHYAAQGFRQDNIELLIGRGMDVNVKDRQGNTPLHTLAMNKGDAADKPKARQNQLAAAKLLLDKGANPLAKNRLGETPFLLADDEDNFSLKKLIKSYIHKQEEAQAAKQKAAEKEKADKGGAKPKAPARN